MFNITHIGNRVDISSSGTSFTITPSFVTGMAIPLPIADIQADGYAWEVSYSGTMIANVKLISSACELRNTNWQGDGIELGIPPRDASGITSTSHLMYYSTELYSTSVVRNGDYIYIAYSNHNDGIFAVQEYQISTGDIQTITIYNDNNYYAYEVQMSMIADRKVLVHNDNEIDYALGYTTVHIVDFALGTFSSTNTPYYVDTLMAIKKSNGNIFLYTIGSDVYDNFEIQYKNYTLDTAWTSVTTSFTVTIWSICGPAFRGEDYIVYPYVIAGGATGYQTKCLLFDLNTCTYSFSSALDAPAVSGGAGNFFINSIAQDMTDHMVYLCGYSLAELPTNPVTYKSSDQWIQLDCDTATLTELAHRDGTGQQPGETYLSVVLSSREFAYFAIDPEREIYLASTQDYIRDLGMQTVYYSTCYQLDDNGPSVWWWDDVGRLLWRSSLPSGDVSYAPSIIENYSCYNMGILHAKDCILMFLHEQQPSSFNHFYRWYLIT